jgi:hypothetical protein
MRDVMTNPGPDFAGAGTVPQQRLGIVLYGLELSFTIFP